MLSDLSIRYDSVFFLASISINEFRKVHAGGKAKELRDQNGGAYSENSTDGVDPNGIDGGPSDYSSETGSDDSANTSRGNEGYDQDKLERLYFEKYGTLEGFRNQPLGDGSNSYIGRHIRGQYDQYKKHFSPLGDGMKDMKEKMTGRDPAIERSYAVNKELPEWPQQSNGFKDSYSSQNSGNDYPGGRDPAAEYFNE